MRFERQVNDVYALPMLRLDGQIIAYDPAAADPPPHLGFERAMDYGIRPWDEVWLVRSGLGRRGTVVETRREQVRVAIGGAVHRVAREDVVGVLPRAWGRDSGQRRGSACRWTAAGWMCPGGRNRR